MPGVIDPLRRVPLFARLTDKQLRWIAERGEEGWLGPGGVYRHEGDPADQVFAMLDGKVRVTQKVEEREVALATSGTGSFFGELPMSLLGILRYFAGGRATRRSHLLELPKDGFWELLRSYPAVSGHKGDVRVESKPGDARLQVRLPANAPDDRSDTP
jgi:CRP-like cAMP-binding protein